MLKLRVINQQPDDVFGEVGTQLRETPVEGNVPNVYLGDLRLPLTIFLEIQRKESMPLYARGFEQALHRCHSEFNRLALVQKSPKRRVSGYTRRRHLGHDVVNTLPTSRAQCLTFEVEYLARKIAAGKVFATKKRLHALVDPDPACERVPVLDKQLPETAAPR